MRMIATAALPVASRSVEALLAGEGGVPADELRRLKRKLDKARGLAADAEAKEGRDAGARAWLRELRDALYEVGDAVDDFRRAGARRQLVGRRSLRHWFTLPSSTDRNQYKSLKTRITNLNTKMKDILKKGSDLELEAINHEGQNGRSEFAWEAVLGDFSLGDIENEKK